MASSLGKSEFDNSFDNRKRDARRSFNSTQRKEILYQQNNKCARCHEDLDPRAIQFDHKQSWASGGRTITVNGRALCGKCHDIVTHENRLKNVDKGKKSSSKINELGIPKWMSKY